MHVPSISAVRQISRWLRAPVAEGPALSEVEGGVAGQAAGHNTAAAVAGEYAGAAQTCAEQRRSMVRVVVVNLVAQHAAIGCFLDHAQGNGLPANAVGAALDNGRFPNKKQKTKNENRLFPSPLSTLPLTEKTSDSSNLINN